MSSSVLAPDPRRGRPLLLSNALDASGRQAADLATDVLAVLVLGATAAQMGLLNALGSLAFLVLGIPIGVLVDRSPSVRLLVAAGMVRAGLLATVVVAWAMDGLTLGHLYAVAVVAGAAGVVVETAQVAIVPRVVGTAGVARLVSRLESAEALAGLLVPALAGAGVALAGAGPALATAAALTALAALVVLRLRLLAEAPPAPAPQGPSPVGALGRLLAEAREGWSTLRGHRALWRLTLASMLVNLGLAVHGAIEVVLVLRTLDLGSGALGVMVSAGALGALAGSLAAVPLSRRFSVATVLRGCVLGLAPVAALTLAALADPSAALWWLVAGSFLWGLVIVVYNVVNAGLAAELTPTPLLGRVSATRRTLTMGIVPTGSVLGGLLAERTDVGWAVVVWVVANACGALVALTALSDLPRRGPGDGSSGAAGSADGS